MSKPTSTIPLPGSERQPLPQARSRGATAPDQPMQVTVLVRRRLAAAGSATLHAHVSAAATGAAHLTPDEFAARFGADPADLAQVAAFAAAHGLRVADTRQPERRMVLQGSAADFAAAFNVTLEDYADAQGVVYRGRRGMVHVPADLAGIVEGVFGLDDRPQARTHFRIGARLPADAQGGHATGSAALAGLAAPADGAAVIRARAAQVSYTPPQLAAAYEFPVAGETGGKGSGPGGVPGNTPAQGSGQGSGQGSNQGSGQCVGIIELGGGYRQADLDAYFRQLGITPPNVIARPVDGARNAPSGDANSADGEVLLDIEVVGAIVPAATLVVYFAPNTDAGFLDAISSAIHDTVHRPSVISISWGGPESSWTAQAMHAMDSVFQDAAALGVTICCAAGDDGSSDQRAPATDDGRLHADFPASSPYALACGGTRLDATGSAWHETVWNAGRGGGATGGGISEVFARPAWQDAARVPPSANPGHHAGRGVPDVAANADPATGYLIRVDGQQMVIGGTSAVAPLYAALVALCNQQLGRRLGYLNPVLYGLPASAQAFRDVRGGDNDISGRHGAYAAGAGWDACTGLGSVRGTHLLAALVQSSGTAPT